MFLYEQEAQMGDDRQDLIEILQMRFGVLPEELEEHLYQLSEFETLQRLILVAANAPTLRVFMEELQEGNHPFKLVGERFNPLRKIGDRNEE
ncbi:MULTISPECIES: hypothetical protein [unclassified Gracilibacillus]|uniref:hypothetical protein n=1 Tax=Gracilibacillus sp. JCM 18860 TaxID=1306159 RepID=UPI0006D08090